MGWSTQNQTLRCLTYSLLILTISSLSHFTFQAEGRKLLDTHRHNQRVKRDHKLGLGHLDVKKDVVLAVTVKPFRFQQIHKLQMGIRITQSTTTRKRPTTLPMQGTATTQTTSQ
ncbi:uncharacterized protein [Solanum tuberosum]|uniref:EPIDERMAL PATTERNING FACTOR 2 n=1 Tax=Solanum tuberosum TaxID=4113 RepID=M1D0S0_SOLTU|nr:PREDICTED: uncharacterized protein LOC102581791 isoform X2 [Solanum tuberosum]